MPEPKTTWRLMVPVLVYTVWNAAKEEERKGAMDELLKLADIVDTYIGQLETLKETLPDTVETAGIIPSPVTASELAQDHQDTDDYWEKLGVEEPEGFAPDNTDAYPGQNAWKREET